jgi:hypothetical protein
MLCRISAALCAACLVLPASARALSLSHPHHVASGAVLATLSAGAPGGRAQLALGVYSHRCPAQPASGDVLPGSAADGQPRLYAAELDVQDGAGAVACAWQLAPSGAADAHAGAPLKQVPLRHAVRQAARPPSPATRAGQSVLVAGAGALAILLEGGALAAAVVLALLATAAGGGLLFGLALLGVAWIGHHWRPRGADVPWQVRRERAQLAAGLLCARVRRSLGEGSPGRGARTRRGAPAPQPADAPGNKQEHAPPAPSFPLAVTHHGRHTQ